MRVLVLMFAFIAIGIMVYRYFMDDSERRTAKVWIRRALVASLISAAVVFIGYNISLLTS